MFARLRISIAISFFLATMATAALAGTQAQMDNELHKLELEWARVTYQITDADDQERQMQGLAERATKIADHYPGRAEPIIWEGIITSSEAKYAGMFSALGFAKQAKAMFEQAGRIDYRALDGAVPTSLGALYYMVPGFPIGFGDNDKARQLLQQGVQISPDGLDSNFFYGDFLFREGEYAAAETVLKHALTAPADASRPVWDAGRRGEIRSLLAKVDQKLAAKS